MSRKLLPVNTYARKDDLEKEFLHGLQQRKIDSKFSYIGKRQAKAWFDLCGSADYTNYKNSMHLLKDCIEDFVSDHRGDVNVIALGPGDALKEKMVSDSLRKKHQVNLFFIDTSREILNVAIANTEDSDELKEVFIADLRSFKDIKEISQYIKENYHPINFFTFLGNTLGNYPQAMIFKTLRNAMTPGDKILIDTNVRLSNSFEQEIEYISEITKGYNSPAAQELMLSVLSKTDIDTTDGELEVGFEPDEYFPQIHVLKQHFCFTRSKVIKYLGEDIHFSKGERILVHYSNKYTLEPLKNLIASHGLCIVKHAEDDKGKYHQILCELA